MVPLAEIIAKSIGIRSPNAKSVTKIYEIIVTAISNECNLWTMKFTALKDILYQLVDEKIANAIIVVRKGNFCFDPPGFDGTYGDLTLNKTAGYHGIKIIQGEVRENKQTTLDSFK